jgi:hypothetical protein
MLTGMRSSLPLAFVLFTAAACKSGLPSEQGEHWGVESVPQRIVKHFTGYRSDMDGEFIDFQYRKKKDINLTLRRHFLNNDPGNPVEPYDQSFGTRRPPHSIAPDPIYYMGAESVFIGIAMMGLSGAFIPIPVDSLVATLFSGKQGYEEFGRGFTEGADAEAKGPPSVGKFRVKNR